MLGLRPFKEMDAIQIASWFTEEKQTVWWSANKFSFPLTAEQLIQFNNTNQTNSDVWQMCAIDEQGKLAGHFMIRFDDEAHTKAYLGFIVVNPEIRGKGNGKRMVSMAVKYAFEILGVNTVSLSVFEDNISAHKCYLSVGFNDIEHFIDAFPYKDEKWNSFKMSIVQK